MLIKHMVIFFASLLHICAVLLALHLLHQRSLNALSLTNSPVPNVEQPLMMENIVIESFPMRIMIPRIHVDAAIENVGVNQGGAMDVPQNIMNVGWYKFSSVPGTIGSAVIDGHVDGKNGEVGIFALLHLIIPGDKLYIVDNNDQLTSYIVSKTHIFNSQDDTSEIFNQIEGSHLNLITCSGTWDKTQQSYTHRTVVFADREIK